MDCIVKIWWFFVTFYTLWQFKQTYLVICVPMTKSKPYKHFWLVHGLPSTWILYRRKTYVHVLVAWFIQTGDFLRHVRRRHTSFKWACECAPSNTIVPLKKNVLTGCVRNRGNGDINIGLLMFCVDCYSNRLWFYQLRTRLYAAMIRPVFRDGGLKGF